MRSLPSPNRIKTHYVYTVWESAQALGRHRQTIIRWIKDNGLIADRSKVPWLIKGSDLKTFLGHRRAKSKTKLDLHHLFCLGCKTPQEPDGKFAEYKQATPTTGMLKAICPGCGSIINKVVRRADLEAIQSKIEAGSNNCSIHVIDKGHRCRIVRKPLVAETFSFTETTQFCVLCLI